MSGENTNIIREQGGDVLRVKSGGQVILEAGAVLQAAAAAQINIGGAVAGAEITVGDEDNDVRAITVQLNDAEGNAIESAQAVLVAVLADAAAAAFATTGGSTGIAIGADGALLAIVAKKLFLAISEPDGSLALTWTDDGSEAAYLAIVLPSGKLVISDALTNTGS